jgi:hypothetical protein
MLESRDFRCEEGGQMLVFYLLSGSERIVHRYTSLAIVTAAFSFGMAVAATPAIGVALSEGTIVVNDAQTPGNATVFNGTTLQTQRTSSQVRLKDGAQVRFDLDSRGTLFSDHVDLQQGSARISDYSANANGLNVRASGGSSANVTMKGKVVEIAALTGDVQVFNAAGMNVANLVPGRALDLRPADAGVNAPSSLTGCPVKSGNNFMLTDEASNVTAQLRGGDLKAGTRVHVTGNLVPNAKAASPATQVIAVTGATEAGGACAPVVAKKYRQQAPAGASAPAAPAAGAGVSTGVIVGVSVAAAAGIAVGAAYGVGAIGGGTPCVPTSAQPCPS